jgi:hypothetical protein
VDYKRVATAVESDDQELAVAADAVDRAAAQRGDEIGVRLTPHSSIAGDGNVNDPLTTQERFKVATNRLNFR